MEHFFAWFEHATGMTNGSGPEYLAWSGWVSDISEISLAVTLVLCLLHWYGAHECHEPTCKKYGSHHTPDGLRVCRNHHPGVVK